MLENADHNNNLSPYQPHLAAVLKKEDEEYVALRRRVAAHEFKQIALKKIEDEKGVVSSRELKNIEQYAALLGASTQARPYIGMAFSGGGIRSATFCLGVVQALSKFGILPWVDYLTSVSGGGFTAGCLTSLLSHEEDKTGKRETTSYPFNVFWERFPFNPDLQVFDTDGVAYEKPETVGDDVPLKKANAGQPNRQLEHLRNLGNYIIPRMGLLTANTLRGLGAFLLRIVYTLLVFLVSMLIVGALHYAVVAGFTPDIIEPLKISAPTSIPPLLFASFEKSLLTKAEYPLFTYATAILFGFVFSFCITWIVSWSYRQDQGRGNQTSRWRLKADKVEVSESYLNLNCGIRRTAAWLLAFFFVLSVMLLAWLGVSGVHSKDLYFYVTISILLSVYFFYGLYFLLNTSGNLAWAGQGLPEQEWVDKLVTFMTIWATFWVMTLVLALLKVNEGFDDRLRIYWIWMPALFMFGGGWGLMILQYSQGLQYTPKVGRFVNGLYSSWAGSDFRSIFWTMQGSFLYGTLGFILLGVILIPHYFLRVNYATQASISLAVAVIAGIWSNYIASGKFRNNFSGATKLFSLPPELWQSLLAVLVFILNLSILFLVETGLDALSDWDIRPIYFMLALGAGVLLWLLGRVNVNYLSAHYFYRDRIADAYLRTEVDDLQSRRVGVPRDDRYRRVSAVQTRECSAPYHIIITALNLSGSWFLQFKDRKSQPFIFSRLYSGSDITGYVQTWDYRSNDTKYSQALALSGAAVSSGLGYLTFFAQAFVITLFNLRLGLWMDNPKLYQPRGRAHQFPMDKHEGSWLLYLWDEMRGRMNERRRLVNLTDGAHTEDNIGLYPLFQRRCKYIIACDAGEDAEGKCEQLMAVIRQVDVDFRIKVDIDVKALKPELYDKEKCEVKESQAHFAIGKITYPATEDHPEEMTGWLVYIRPSIVKNDPAPILQYWQKHKLDFPHPSTADQFFNEEQFEVVRLLGEWSVVSALMELQTAFKSGRGSKSRARFLRHVIELDKEKFPKSFKLPYIYSGFEKLFEKYHSMTSHS